MHPGSAGRARRPRAAAFLALTKPRIIELLLVTTVPVMFLAAGGFPSFWLVLATLVGGALAAGSANTLNCYVDRDIDALMDRTRERPLVTGEVSPREALVFGVALGVVAVGWLATLVNVLSAALALAAIAFYLFVYTLGLKRRTSQNIVWGGAAGCIPVLVGWSSVTGSLAWAPLVLFGVVFLWTPPHYWPLSMRYARDYSAVHVPMLGAVERPGFVARRILAYSWAMVACSLLLVPVAGTGPVYTFAAVLLGAWFLAEAHALRRRAARAEESPEPVATAGAMRVFHVSISYLTLLFLAVGVDPFVGWW
ncbi:heme o synthase [Pseudokineococcus sp. 1T1Z-3]|uniref:heme o synthase n=1 Tax=Pseudokineococcus sp. 1T1Z-3 TaxID=3132745 RepID=UPI00403FB98A